jgi:hypothetical protein
MSLPNVIVGVDGPTASRAKLGASINPRGEPSMNEISRFGIDTSKAVFTVHGVDASG